MEKQKVRISRKISNALLGSFNNPAPYGATNKARMDRSEAYLPEPSDICQIELTVLETMRGQKAKQQIKIQNITNKLPPKGYEYILVRCKLGYLQKGTGIGAKDYEVISDQFSVVSANGKQIFDAPNVINQPQPHLIGYSLKFNEVRNGWILLQVPESEKKPLLIFKRENTNSLIFGLFNYMWFQLT